MHTIVRTVNIAVKWSTIAGFALLGLAELRHGLRNGGEYRSLFKKRAADDIKLLKIAAVLVFFGILVGVINTVLFHLKG
jgi:hypothetical protein